MESNNLISYGPFVTLLFRDEPYIYKGKKQLIDHMLEDEGLTSGRVFTTLELAEGLSDHRVVIYYSKISKDPLLCGSLALSLTFQS